MSGRSGGSTGGANARVGRSDTSTGTPRGGSEGSEKGLRRDGPTRDAARSRARQGIRRRRDGRARARRRAASRTRGNGARDARAWRAVARGAAARALPRGSGGGEKHIRRRGAGREGEGHALTGADRARVVTRIGQTRDAPKLRHCGGLVCAVTTVCAFARGCRSARRPLITRRTIESRGVSVDARNGRFGENEGLMNPE